MRGFGAALCLNPEKDLTGTRQSGQRTGCELEMFVFTINRTQLFPNWWLQPHATISSPVWFSRQIPHGSSVGRFSSEIFKTRGLFSVRLIQRSIASSLLSLALWTRWAALCTATWRWRARGSAASRRVFTRPSRAINSPMCSGVKSRLKRSKSRSSSFNQEKAYDIFRRVEMLGWT